MKRMYATIGSLLLTAACATAPGAKKTDYVCPETGNIVQAVDVINNVPVYIRGHDKNCDGKIDLLTISLVYEHDKPVKTSLFPRFYAIDANNNGGFEEEEVCEDQHADSLNENDNCTAFLKKHGMWQ